MWLEPVEERIVLDKLGVATALERPQKTFLNMEVVIENGEHLENLKHSLNIDTTVYDIITWKDSL